MPAVLINPAMRPWQLFRELFDDELPLQVHPNWCLNDADLDQLEAMALPTAQDADKILVLLQQGDEVLDYREAHRYYSSARPPALLMTEANGSHGMDDFAEKIPLLLQFLSDCIKRKPNNVSQYTAQSLEVLSGLDPVRRRPGMYTDTSRPNHLAQEVIDNAVDEALAGHANKVTVTVYKDGSLSVEDNGRGMPVDIHPEYGQSGIEIILTKLHAGGKFSTDNYQFSGGLHGVGISVVNALSSRVEVEVQRHGNLYKMAFENGEPTAPLEVLEGKAPKRATGTTVHFWPETKYFDSPKFALKVLKHNLKAKAVLAAGLQINYIDQINDEKITWQFENGLVDYLMDELEDREIIPAPAFVATGDAERASAEFAICWNVEGGESIQESYVNLIPTAQGGTHVNGLRSGVTDAMREFCELRNLLPRNMKLSAEDVWDGVNYILSLKFQEPQFSGQTKERLSSREASGIVQNIAKDAFALWLNQNSDIAMQLAEMAISKQVAV